MRMPICEILDRYTICILKLQRTKFDVSGELNAYKKEIKSYHPKKQKKIQEFIKRLFIANRDMWDAEEEIGMHYGIPLSFEELGKLTIKARELNRIRNGIKAEIVDAFGEGFKDIGKNRK